MAGQKQFHHDVGISLEPIKLEQKFQLFWKAGKKIRYLALIKSREIAIGRRWRQLDTNFGRSWQYFGQTQQNLFLTHQNFDLTQPKLALTQNFGQFL